MNRRQFLGKLGAVFGVSAGMLALPYAREQVEGAVQTEKHTHLAKCGVGTADTDFAQEQGLVTPSARGLVLHGTVWPVVTVGPDDMVFKAVRADVFTLGQWKEL